MIKKKTLKEQLIWDIEHVLVLHSPFDLSSELDEIKGIVNSKVDGLVVTLQNQKKELEEDRKQYVFGHTMRMFINGKIREIDEVLGLLGVED